MRTKIGATKALTTPFLRAAEGRGQLRLPKQEWQIMYTMVRKGKLKCLAALCRADLCIGAHLSQDSHKAVIALGATLLHFFPNVPLELFSHLESEWPETSRNAIMFYL